MIGADHCIKALAARFPPREYALIEQVANGTGSHARRWADAVAISLWPSRGLLVHGFEIKVYKTDWKRELANPEKSSKVQAYCDHWWIVAPEGLVETDELPPTWGLIDVLKGGKSKVRVKAPKLDAQPLTRTFVAAVMRKYADSHDAIVRRECVRAREEGAESGAGELAHRLKVTTEDLQKLHKQIDEFEKASGVKIRYGWDLPNIGKAVDVLMHRGRNIVEDMRTDAERYRRTAELLDRGATEIAEALPKEDIAKPA
jgi:hypothetical protein